MNFGKSKPPLAAPVPTADKRELMQTAAELEEANPAAFQPPPMSPAPVEGLSQLELDPWAFLDFQDPIEDAAMLAFQVAQLTVGMGEILRELATLREAVTNLVTLEDFPETIRAEIKARIERRLSDELPAATADVSGPDEGNR